jgi:ribosomal protein L7/L12
MIDNKFTRDEITPVLMALDTKVRVLQTTISEDVLDGEYKRAARAARDLTAILNGMAEFDSLAPKYPEFPEDNMPEMTAFYILRRSGGYKSKIPAIKIVKDAFGLSLYEAKKIVDSTEGADVFVGYKGSDEAKEISDRLYDEGYFPQVVHPGDGDAKYLAETALTLEDLMKSSTEIKF